ncbi:hypothetical protein Tco_1252547 [Tanacetum coccineum]
MLKVLPGPYRSEQPQPSNTQRDLTVLAQLQSSNSSGPSRDLVKDLTIIRAESRNMGIEARLKDVEERLEVDNNKEPEDARRSNAGRDKCTQATMDKAMHQKTTQHKGRLNPLTFPIRLHYYHEVLNEMEKLDLE